MKPSLALIGPGKVGSAVTRRLFDAGFPIAAVVGRDQNRTQGACRFIGCSETLATTALSSALQGDIILIAVPDNDIRTIAAQLMKLPAHQPDCALIHFSGVHEAAIMADNRTAKQGLLSFHPLLPFATAEAAHSQLSDCPCALEGNPKGIALGHKLSNAIGARSFQIESRNKEAYHAAACMASNFMVTLVAIARDVLSTCNIEKKEALLLLKPLINATLDNIFSDGPEQGLTGPIIRGDDQTIGKHLATLAKQSDSLVFTYLALARQTLELAENSGRLNCSDAEKLEELLSSALQNLEFCSTAKNIEK